MGVMQFIGGLPETRCGRGSMILNTGEIRSKIPGLLRSLGVKMLLDAPCGDCNWISRVDLQGIEYAGIDLDEHNLSDAVRRMPSGRFYRSNIVKDDLPKSDLMLCRDFLQHLPSQQALSVVQNFLRSGTKWFLATSHDNAQNDDIKYPGEFRPINLMAYPFMFPTPDKQIADGGRILGLWRREAIG